MLRNEWSNNNAVSISGIVNGEISFNHEIYGEKFYRFYLDINRISHAVDRVIVMVSERLLGEWDIHDGVFVHIEGQFRSYNITEGIQRHLFLTVFVREIMVLSNTEKQYKNQIELTGHICKAVNYRVTPLGREISDVLLAVNRSYKKSDYIPCIAWGRNARFVKDFEVGQKIKLMGRIQSRNYIKHIEGVPYERTTYEVSISQLATITD
jgi:primosomal replication protein N